MRTVLFAFAFLASQVLPAQNAGKGVVEFTKTKIHLGMVDRGAKVSDKFEFINTSDEPVEIDLVSTCDCTHAKWTKGPIAPGRKGVVSFIFDSNKKELEEPVDVDVHFKNKDPETGYPLVVFLSYTFKYPDR